MQPILRTSRFSLREFTEDDRDAFIASHQAPLFARFHQPHEREVAHLSSVFDLFLAWQSETPRRNYQLAIATREAEAGYIGNVGLRMQGMAEGEGEIGIELRPDYWGRGAAREVTRAFLEWARDRDLVRTLTAETAPGNVAAERLAATAGLRLVGQAGKRQWRGPLAALRRDPGALG